MQILHFLAFPIFAILTAPLMLVLDSPPRPGRPVLVIVPPWRDPEQVLIAAGGWPGAPVRAPLAALASAPEGIDPGRFAARLRGQGAAVVIDAGRLANLCGG